MKYANKQRVLVVTSRGVSARQRHLVDDVAKLLPHHKKESKVDAKKDLRSLNELAELGSCNGVVYFEARKHALYLWISRRNGPAAKFGVLNVHTTDELRLTGNCALGSRPLLCFHNFRDDVVIFKHLLAITFGTPRGHPKSKPFFDHCLSFSMLDGKIWLRHYQTTSDDQLVEIGPRFVLDPIRVLAGSFSGSTIYHVPTEPKKRNKLHDDSYERRQRTKLQRKEHKRNNQIPKTDLDGLFAADNADFIGPDE
ncbi:hypothetical protein CTAYLR_004498 [Chrysophaeum taylorii]|uniref:Brix domain-containing protein n=1 Tax=Chrysophaeum taylorii TaxID=2483200 RepID=A0AAD7UA11_9STRA|nr:hypothetical protein CTAYLR_004498 [Chrysophaeum taylorii]